MIVSLGSASTARAEYENFADAVPLTPAGDHDINVGGLAIGLSDTLHAIYVGEVGAETWTAVRSSYDGGVTWDDFAVLDQTTSYPGGGTNVFADRQQASTLYAFYTSTVGGFGRSLVRRSLDAGLTWQPPSATLSDLQQDSRFAQSPITGAVVIGYSTFFDGETNVVTSFDHGASFTSPVLVDDNFSNPAFIQGLAYLPNGTLVIIYLDYPTFGTRRLVARRSTNDGLTWGPEIDVQVGNLTSSPSGDLAYFMGALHFVNSSVADPNTNVVHRISTDGGLTWDEPQELVAIPDDGDFILDEAGDVTLAPNASDTVLVMSYSDRRSFFPIAFYNDLYSLEYDGSWTTTPRRINNHGGNADNYGGMASDSTDRMFAVWGDSRWNDFTVSADRDPELTVAVADPLRTQSIGVEIDLTSPVLQAQRGDLLTIPFKITNFSCDVPDVDVVVEYFGVNGVSGVAQVNRDLAVGCLGTLNLLFTTTVGISAPFQNYDVRVTAGALPSTAFDSDAVTIEVIP